MSDALPPLPTSIPKAREFLMFVAVSVAMTIVAAALIEVARRKGWIRQDPASALANILSPASALGAQTAPPAA